jgi:hypothetical protein
MTEAVTQCTMWKDALGRPWDTEDQATASNASTDLTAWLQMLSESGQVIGMDGCNLSQLATALLANYTMTPIVAG